MNGTIINGGFLRQFLNGCAGIVAGYNIFCGSIKSRGNVILISVASAFMFLVFLFLCLMDAILLVSFKIRST